MAAFVRDIVSNRRSQATVCGIVELAKRFSIDTVAEFVENADIANKVRELGVDYAQGYAFGRPEPLDGLLLHIGRDESRRLHKLFLEM
jgi:EAL domain-containing protein (putative c-di-GMP-specific phosphodiesterase class I)